MAYQKKQYRDGSSRGGTPSSATYTANANPKRYPKVEPKAKPADNYLRKNPA